MIANFPDSMFTEELNVGDPQKALKYVEHEILSRTEAIWTDREGRRMSLSGMGPCYLLNLRDFLVRRIRENDAVMENKGEVQ